MSNYSFMILTGGKSSRFGSHKSEIEFDGTTLLQRLCERLPAGEIVIVGPERNISSRKIQWTHEEPIGGGPVAAIAAGIEKITSELVIVLATDLPFASEIIPYLVKTPIAEFDALMPIDENGQRQMLCALYKKSPLIKALGELHGVQGQSMKALVKKLTIREITIPSNKVSKLIDIDTPVDLTRAQDIQRQEKSTK